MAPKREPKPKASRPPEEAAAPEAREDLTPPAPFPIVGIGASAGGLEALEEFLRGVPEGTQTAFVVVQHLDPTRRGMVPELLQRVTKMEVLQVRDGMPVEPGRVYVIPSNKDLSLLHDKLHLLPPTAPRGLRLPIDAFFRSLAEDRQERAIGVILSGMGSDGTAGLRAIKEKAGLALVQDPNDAHFDGMPRSAIDAGLADIVAPAAELPARITAYLGHAPLLGRRREPHDARAQSSLEKILLLLRQRSGHDFSLYKKSTLYRRIERRMGLHQLDRIATYVRFLQESPGELDLLFKELLIGVTGFFRDPEAWEQLKSDVLRPLLAAPSSTAFRAWVAGCSTGEEAYSLAMLFQEAAAEVPDRGRRSLQIFATDIDAEAIERARQGVYPASVVGDVSPERLRRFFVQEEPGYRVAKEIREMVIFAVQNVIQDPPFTRLDLLSCRNLLIYLEAECQKRLVPLFHYSLNPGGVLFLGNAETIGSFTDLFDSVGSKARLYRRSESSALRAEAVAFPVAPVPVPPDGGRRPAPEPAPASLQALADQLILRHCAPPAVLTNPDGDLLYVSGHTGKYLEPALGKANLNLFAMAREGLRYDLAAAFQKVRRGGGPVTVPSVRVRTNAHWQAVKLTVRQVVEPEGLAGTVLVVFEDVPEAPDRPRRRPSARGAAAGEAARLEELEKALLDARAGLQTTREEMQSSQEELKSANEELQSANEELQSTNEELTTSKEEMQSMNEELQTLNAELVAKVEELSRANNDMKNLLNSTDVATLFLDGELRVRRFTTPATRLIRLIPGDVGRPITDITSRLDYPELPEDAREVLRTLASRETVVAAEGGRWFAARTLPYRTADNRIDGVVITFWDVTSAKKLEGELREAREEIERLRSEGPK